MSLRIGSNVTSGTLVRRLAQVSEGVSRVFERLSSGMRINRASDDAAGLSIMSAAQSDARVFRQGVRNATDAQSLLAIADSTLEQLSLITTRQRELAEQAATGTLGREQRLALQSESDALADEFNRIVSSTRFNGVDLFRSSSEERLTSIQVGIGDAGVISFELGGELGRATGDGTFTLGTTYSGVYIPAAIRIADLNGDGLNDLAIAGRYNNNGVQILLNQGNGTFSQVHSFLDPTGGGLGELELADFNNDGRLDLLWGGEPLEQLGRTPCFSEMEMGRSAPGEP